MASPLAPAVKDFSEPRRHGLRLDPLLLLATVALLAAGVYVVGTATRDDIPGDPNYYVYRQAAFGAIGLVLMYACSRVDYSRLRGLKWPLYAVMLSSLVAVMALGSVANGARRAIQFPFFSFQASELGKVLLCVVLASFLVDRARRLHSLEHPHLLRLLLWEALDRGTGPVSDEPARTEHYRRKVSDAYPERGADGDPGPLTPERVMFLIMAMAAWWEAVPQVARMMTGVGQVTSQEHARRRSAVVEAARRLTA
jgi:hypothetical protein